MKLRRQLFLVSLLLLSLPWAGCQYIRELDSTLAFAQQQAMTATAQAVAAVLAQQPDAIYPYPQDPEQREATEQQLFFQRLDQAVVIDGYGEDWQELPFKALELTSGDDSFGARYKSGIRGRQLMLFIEVDNAEQRYHNPTLARVLNGDRLELLLAGKSDQPPQRVVLNSSAPGQINAFAVDTAGKLSRRPQISAHWQEQPEGYSIELSLPLNLTGGRLGFSLIADRSPQYRPGEDGYAGRVAPPLSRSISAISMAHSPPDSSIRQTRYSNSCRFSPSPACG